MTEFFNILLYCDGNGEQSAAITRATELANNNQAALTVCAVVDAVPADLHTAITAVTPAELIDIAVAERRRQLEEEINKVVRDAARINIKILVGKAFIEIIRQVLQNDHDLVIKCADHDKSLKTRLFGSTDMNLLRNCPCPVWIVKTAANRQLRRTAVGVSPLRVQANRTVARTTRTIPVRFALFSITVRSPPGHI